MDQINKGVCVFHHISKHRNNYTSPNRVFLTEAFGNEIQHCLERLISHLKGNQRNNFANKKQLTYMLVKIRYPDPESIIRSISGKVIVVW